MVIIQLCSIEIKFYSETNFVLEPPFWGLGGNLRTPYIALYHPEVKGKPVVDRLPICHSPDYHTRQASPLSRWSATSK